MANDPYDLSGNPRVQDLDQKLRNGQVEGVSDADLAGYLKVRNLLYPDAGKHYPQQLCICICLTAPEESNPPGSATGRFGALGD